MEDFKNIIKEKQQDEEQIDIQTFVEDADQVESYKQSKQKQGGKQYTQGRGMQGTPSNWNGSSGLPPAAPSQGGDPLVYQAPKKMESEDQKN